MKSFLGVLAIAVVWACASLAAPCRSAAGSDRPEADGAALGASAAVELFPGTARAERPVAPGVAGLPRIGLSDTLLHFEGYRYGNSPAGQQFTITNTTDIGVLRWSIATDRFFVGAGPQSGESNEQIVQVWIIATIDLTIGLHTANVIVSAANAVNSPDTVFVEVEILCPILKTGDVNADGVVTQGDIIYLVNHVLKAGPAPRPMPEAGDVNCDRFVGLADVIYLVNFVLKAGMAPCDACSLL